MSAPVRAPGGGRKSSDNLASVGDASLKRVHPPKDLIDDVAKEMWREQSKNMIERGTLSREDLPLLLTYCNSFSFLKRADEEILRKGFYAETADGSLKKHPAVNVRNDMVTQLKVLGSLLGLDPMSRLRMLGSGKSNDTPSGNEFEEF